MVFDAIVVGGGGAGMRAALALSGSGLNTAVVTKVFPTRSHTVSAQGGITCAIASVDPKDDWRWHMYDTVKGSDYIGDQDAIEYMCEVGPQVVFELEHMGMPFSRLENGRIYQRPFGGQSKNYGKGGQAARTCAAADRTGHALLHTLFQNNIKHETVFLNEYFVIDLIQRDDGSIAGITAIQIETGQLFAMYAKAVVLATGGAGRIYASTTNAHINTGDGVGMCARAGLMLQDMEMWQFHPTGIYGAGVLVTEGCRGEGGYLLNKDGERFMERYAPNTKDLASRDVVARSMAIEIAEGRGCGDKGDHLHLKLDHLGSDILNERLPGIQELAQTFAHVDSTKEPIPVVPTCHYMMGGVPTNKHGQVLMTKHNKDSIVAGLYACGEVACVSVHGANRLGGNSLLDLVVFGRACGQHITEFLDQENQGDIKKDDIEKALDRVHQLDSREKGESIVKVRSELQHIMSNHFGIFRMKDVMQEGIKLIEQLRDSMNNLYSTDKSQVFNTSRIEALELQNMFEVAVATAHSALERTESRGAHCRDDYTDRDDKNWLCHSVYHQGKVSKRKVNNKPKSVDSFEPQKRVY